jgi:hypothetical protein
VSVKEMAELIGRHMSVSFESVAITCKVIDLKMAYGRPRLLVAPVAGSGQQWIETSRVLAFQGVK